MRWLFVFWLILSVAYVARRGTARFTFGRQLSDHSTLALAVDAAQKISAAPNYSDIGFNSFFKTGWRRFYLKWYDAPHPSAQSLCPVTTRLLQDIPGIKAAMFAQLPPGASLVRHRDPYAGSVRYHLGLVTPADPKCHIDVDGQQYYWQRR
jgi:beta-hydroxylase